MVLLSYGVIVTVWQVLCAQQQEEVRLRDPGGPEVQHHRVQQGDSVLAAGGADPQHHRHGRGPELSTTHREVFTAA